MSTRTILSNIRNPKTFYVSEWYLERMYRIYLGSRELNLFYEEFLSTEEQQLKEINLKLSALKDLREYILGADQKRKFIIHFLEIMNDYNYYECKFQKGKWRLLEKEHLSLEEGNITYTTFHTKRFIFTNSKLTELANSNLVIGIRLIEIIQVEL